MGDMDAYDKIIEVVETIPAGGEGRVSFRGTSWVARHYHNDIPCLKGTRVRILFRENLIWIVEHLENGHVDRDFPKIHNNNGQP